MMRRVGILGGMGPQATILVMQKILASVQASDDADHISLIVDQNTQVPSRIRHLIDGTGENPAPALAAMACRLVAGGAEALAMPCNTAHYYASVIQTAVDVPFLDMVQLSATHAASMLGSDRGVGILASPAVKKVGLFDAPLSRLGLHGIYPSDDAAMLTAIRQLKSNAPAPEAHRSLIAASEDLLRQGARVQLIACTEFSLIAQSVAPESKAFDTLDILVNAINEFSLEADVECIHATN